MTQNGWPAKRLIDRDLVARAIGTADALGRLQQLAAQCAAEGISLEAVCDSIRAELADAMMDASNGVGADRDSLFATLSTLAQSSAIRAYGQMSDVQIRYPSREDA